MRPGTDARSPVYGSQAMAATGHPAATAAAVEVLAEGGNAVDAALAASAVLCVVLPHMTGIGGDGFVQVVEPDGRVLAYNSGGTAGSGARPERYGEAVPRDGLGSACVPGLPDAWAALHEAHGSMPLDRLFARAVDLARNGFPLSAGVAGALAEHAARLAKSAPAAAIFLASGRPPQAAERLRQPQLAQTLEAFAAGGRAAFYGGPIGAELALAFAEQAAGLISAADLLAHECVVGEPLRAPYRDVVVTEQPPISQGHVLLQELLLLEPFDLASQGHLSSDSIHTMIEAKKLAFADRSAAAGDPRFLSVDWADLLSPERARDRARTIDPERASLQSTADSKPTDTTQFAVGDRDGRAVSFIQSVYHPFGCAAVAGKTGVLLNNRMVGFSLTPGHPNVMAPGKRTVHTLNTFTLFRNGEFWLAAGTPGADFQVQTNMQLITGLVDYDLSLQAAIDAARWGHTAEREVVVEERIPASALGDLERRGHVLQRQGDWIPGLGSVQAVARLPSGGWEGVSDLRREGAAIGF